MPWITLTRSPENTPIHINSIYAITVRRADTCESGATVIHVGRQCYAVVETVDVVMTKLDVPSVTLTFPPLQR